MSELYSNVASLLDRHGLTGLAEEQLTNSGYSGAALTTIARPDGERFVLKRMSIERDWIMRATDDHECREVRFASSGVALSDRILTPTVGAAHDGDGYVLLMRDITEHLLPAGPVTEAQLDAIIGGMAALHAPAAPEGSAVPWCALGRRLLLLTPAGATIAQRYGAPVARDLRRGWELFERMAPAPVVELIRELSSDVWPLIRALTPLPRSLLHGDLKFDNVGVDADGRLWLIDWAMPTLAPAAVELGWFLAINSRRLPVSLDETMARYASAADMAAEHLERHDAATALCGLLLRGWRKALDADEGEPAELRWWCERAAAASALL